MRYVTRCLSLAAAALVLACGGGDDGLAGVGGPLAGLWTAESEEGTVSLQLSQNGASLSGTGSASLTSGAGGVFVVSGSVSNDVVTLQVTTPVAITFSGSLTSPTTLEGVLNGWEFSNLPVTFHKQ